MFVGLYIAKNFAEVVFQTMEPLFRALVGVTRTMQALIRAGAHWRGICQPRRHPSRPRHHPAAGPRPLHVMAESDVHVQGSKSDYSDAVFALPLQMLGSLGIVQFADDFTGRGRACIRHAHVVSADMHYIYRYPIPPLANHLFADTTPPAYAATWQALAQIVTQYFVSGSAGSVGHERLINVTVLDRPTGRVTPAGAPRDYARKILNIEQVVTHLARLSPLLHVRRVLMEDHPLAAQLRIVQDTHILIAVHGAGAIHTAFLPPGAAFIHVAPFLVHHELFPKVCLAVGRACLELRQTSIAQSVLYSHEPLPPPCNAALRTHFAIPPNQPLVDPAEVHYATTASGLRGVDGSTYARFSAFIAAHPAECRANAYFWKQQDLRVDVAALGDVVLAAMGRLTAAVHHPIPDQTE